jgi:hypothetical protein
MNRELSKQESAFVTTSTQHLIAYANDSFYINVQTIALSEK